MKKKIDFKTKNTVAIGLIYVILLGVFNLLVFTIFKTHSDVFWISYILMTVAFAVQIVSMILSFKTADVETVFFGIPLASFSVFYLCAELAIGALFMIFQQAGFTLALVVQLVVLAAFLVIAIISLLARDAVQEISGNIKEKVADLRSVLIDVEMMRDGCSDPAVKEKLNKLSETIRYSDPMDTSYRRLDSAAKNLLECEKIDSKYVGTLIAKIAYDMVAVITPGACSERDAKNRFAQLKKNYEQLQEISTTITEDEEALYEFLEESDIYATLILVFDSLNDTTRRDFVATLLEPKEVYSKAANGNLLSYAIKNSLMELIDDIISNADNVDVRFALAEILHKYPDGEKKGEHAKRLLETGALQYEDRSIVERYLASSADAVATKAVVLVAALESGMEIGLECTIENVLKKASVEQVRAVVPAVCKEKLTDEEVLRLVEFGFQSESAEVAVCVLTCIRNSGQFLLIPAKFLIALLGMDAYTPEDKVCILNECFAFKMDNKAFEAVVTNYLCYSTSPVQDRKKILDCLFARATTFPTNTVETYVLKSTADGEEKPNIVLAMFDKGLTISFLDDLLADYMNGGADTVEVNSRIVDILSEKGLKVDPSALIDYICDSTDELPVKMQFVQRMIRNGSQLRGDAANAYLERTAPASFSPELFALIFSPSSTFSARGVEKYLLEMWDREANKASNLRTILEHSNMQVASHRCQILHLGYAISCNILQAYLLTTSDAPPLAFEIADYFVNQAKIKINAEMVVAGRSMKLKKYASDNRARLSGTANAICERYRVYSMLF